MHAAAPVAGFALCLHELIQQGSARRSIRLQLADTKRDGGNVRQTHALRVRNLARHAIAQPAHGGSGGRLQVRVRRASQQLGRFRGNGDPAGTALGRGARFGKTQSDVQIAYGARSFEISRERGSASIEDYARTVAERAGECAARLN